MTTKWFKAKNYGWGWYPATWHGWVVTLVFVLLIIFSSYRVEANSHFVSDSLLNIIPQNVLLVMLLIAICYKKGERPEWRWRGKRIKF
ncbi:hypothetical protein C4564_02470 [Candidatus Microgenomates bacterium]|nr:MAG: hypothetical protein C4564_02470 [Candidatus Microgenomates bacterium]